MAEGKRPDDTRSRLDAFVEKVTGDPANPRQTLLLSGFLGASSDANLTRIYSDETLENYIDIATEDIVHTEPRPKSDSPLGGSYIWVKKDAEVTYGMAGTDRSKAKFLEGPISDQVSFAGTPDAAMAAAGGIGAALPPTVPIFACHPTLLVPQCRSIAPFHCPTRIPCPSVHPVFCPPTPLPHLCPTRHPFPCPVTLQHCPTLPFACPPITVNSPHCAASGGGIGCPIDTPRTPQTPQGIPGMDAAQQGAAFAAPQAAPGAVQIAPSVFCHSVLTACHSVPFWHCNTSLFICHYTAPIVCRHTIFEPHCFPVPTPTGPLMTAGCPQQPGGFENLQFADPAAAAAAPLPPTHLPAACFTVAASVCCPTLSPFQCHTRIPVQCPTHYHCPTQNQYHCPTVNRYHCPSVGGYHCPTPHCPTPACPTQNCTEIGPHCNPTPNPVHCPTPNQMCPPPTSHCPSAGEICPTSSPLFCGTLPPDFAGPAAAPGQAAPQPGAQAAIPRTFLYQCGVTVNYYCGPSAFAWCPPATLHAPCFTPRCPW